MFGKKKKNKQEEMAAKQAAEKAAQENVANLQESENQSASQQTQSPKENIYVMPDRFYLEENKKNNKKIFIIVGILLFVGGGTLIAGVVVYNSYRADAPPTADENFVVESTPTPTPDLVPSPTPVIIATPTPTAETDQTPTPTETPSSTPDNSDIAVTGSVDIDSDGLTLNEEKIYSTNPSRDDTDNDGFSDGEEIQNGYSPIEQGKTLSNSRLVEEYKDNRYGFSILYPTRWLLSSSDLQAGRDIVFDSKISEKIFVHALETNRTYNSVSEYVTENYPEISASSLRSFSVDEYSGVKTVDELYFFLSIDGDLSNIIVLEYKPVSEAMRSFQTTFLMMVNSFENTGL